MIQVKPLRSSACARMVQAGLLTAVLALSGTPSLAQQPGEQPQRLQAITLNAGMHNILAELALTPEQRQMGLMYRRDLAGHPGMLFVFDEATPQCFWMKNKIGRAHV